MKAVTSIAQLEEIYGVPGQTSMHKVTDRITPQYRKLIEASAVCALATVGPEGLDASPRGDIGKVLYELDEKTLLMPDWRGNNRMDSLRNIVRDPRVALMLMIGGSDTVMRINGRAIVSLDAELINRFDDRGRKPRSVVVVNIEEMYFQCARALQRAGFWDSKTWPDEKAVPTAGQILQDMTDHDIDGAAYDAEWPERAKTTLW